MIDTLDSKRFDGLYALGSEESSVEGLGGLAGRDHAPHAGRIHGPVIRAAGQPRPRGSLRRGAEGPRGTPLPAAREPWAAGRRGRRPWRQHEQPRAATAA